MWLKLRLQRVKPGFDQQFFKPRRFQFPVARFPIVVMSQPASDEQPIDQDIPLKRAVESAARFVRQKGRLAKTPVKNRLDQEKSRQVDQGYSDAGGKMEQQPLSQ